MVNTYSKRVLAQQTRIYLWAKSSSCTADSTVFRLLFSSLRVWVANFCSTKAMLYKVTVSCGATRRAWEGKERLNKLIDTCYAFESILYSKSLITKHSIIQVFIKKAIKWQISAIFFYFKNFFFKVCTLLKMRSFVTFNNIGNRSFKKRYRQRIRISEFGVIKISGSSCFLRN